MVACTRLVKNQASQYPFIKGTRAHEPPPLSDGDWQLMEEGVSDFLDVWFLLGRLHSGVSIWAVHIGLNGLFKTYKAKQKEKRWNWNK